MRHVLTVLLGTALLATGCHEVGSVEPSSMNLYGHEQVQIHGSGFSRIDPKNLEIRVGGAEALNRSNREDQAKRALREALADWPRADLRTETARHYGPYWQGLATEAHIVFANLLRGLGDTEIRIDPAVPISARQRIIEHELGHARGVPHVDDPACAMRSPPLLDEGLCTFEVDRAKAFGGVSRVRILDEILREPTLAAMARWNDAAGETLFEERE